MPAAHLSGQDRIGLCLSGGGFRAALFHLGALQRLNELGILSRVDVISSASGGSILAAHLAESVRTWPQPGEPVPDWETRVAGPFRAFCARDIRTGPVLRRILNPLNWFDSTTQVRGLEAAYRRWLTQRKMSELPAHPEFVFCATDMALGVNWVFQRERAGDYVAGYADTPSDWTVARATAGSSCFPPIFSPQRVGLRADQFKGGTMEAGPERDRLLNDLRLTDGGVYDNLGLEPVFGSSTSPGTLLVSDGGAMFKYEMSNNALWRFWRYVSIVQDQVGKVRRRWLIDKFKFSPPPRGAFWSVSSATESFNPGVAYGYSKKFAVERISEVRTDLDAFSPDEAGVLGNHGYWLADIAAHTHLKSLLPDVVPPLAPPRPDLADESAAREALRDSHIRRWFGRK